MTQPKKIAAVQISRRQVAMALFEGERLQHTEMKSLAAVKDKAEQTVIGFVRWILTTLEPELLVLPKFATEGGTIVDRLSAAAAATSQKEGVPVTHISTEELFNAFGMVPLKAKRQLHVVAGTVFPFLNNKHWRCVVLDAAAMGLLVQVRRSLQSPNN